jgi:hypothetical protein
MNRRQILEKWLKELADKLTNENLIQLLDFAQFLRMKQEANEWSLAGSASIEKCYGVEEDEYTEADIKPELNQ